MNLPQLAVEIVNKLYQANLTLANGSEDDRRKLTRKIAEQLRFSLGVNWGTKSTSSSAPQSKDAIAFLKSSNIMDIWDWQDGTSRKPKISPNQPPDYPDTTGQFFIDVNPIDHLNLDNGNDNGDDGEPGDDLTPILNKISELESIVQAQNELLQIMAGDISLLVKTGITVKFPEYESNKVPIFGVVTLKPKP